MTRQSSQDCPVTSAPDVCLGRASDGGFMDPNATLTEIRELAYRIVEERDSRESTYDRLAELVQALDEWITRGGFLPNDWKR